jgi:hypothetical protein
VRTFTRRTVTAALAFAPLLATARAQTGSPAIHVTKDPGCGCCSGWVDHLRQAGFSVRVTDSADLAALKKRLGIPEQLASCHTAEAAGLVIEGHVPADAIRRFLAQKPAGAMGLAVPGMPVGSPGMEVPGTPPETYDVVAFGAFGQRTFARYRGVTEIGR